MAPVSDAEWVFGLFLQSGPMTIGIGDIAKKRGLTAGALTKKLQAIQKRHPGFELHGTAKGSGLVFKTDDTDIKVITPTATPATASRKKPVKSTSKPNGSTLNTDTRTRTRSISKAEPEDSEDEDDQVQPSPPNSQAPKSTAVSKTKDALATSSNVAKSKKTATAKNTQSHENDGNKENEDGREKSSPRTRGGRKSVGRELEPPPELPKPAPRGRNASRARSVKAEKTQKKLREEKANEETVEETEDTESTNLAEEDQVIESVEVADATSTGKGRTTDFVKKLIVETSEGVVVGTKRKRTPSPVQEDIHEEHLESLPNTHTASILTPPDSPSKQPPAKKQKLDIIETHFREAATAGFTSERSGEDVSIQEELTSDAEVDVQDLNGTAGDGEREQDQASIQNTAETKAATPSRFPWMSWDPDAVPEAASSEGLGRVVSNEYAREWRERNAAAKAEELEIAP